MSVCHSCQRPLTDLEQKAGQCPHCGAPVIYSAEASADAARLTVREGEPEAVQGKTVGSRQIEQTIIVDVGSVAPSGKARQPDDKSTKADIDQTVDSGTFVGVAAGGKPDTVPDQPYSPTVESGSIPSDLATYIGQTWSDPSRGDSSPLMTLKGQTQTRPNESTLVVQQRALRRASDRTTVNADYDLIEKLGEGGMGFVYLARQTSINRIVALKMLKADTAANAEQRFKFLSEAVVTGDLDHPNIVPIYDLGSSQDGALFYSMKRVQGTPWLDVIQQKSLQENVEILMKVADAVAFAHARGVVHRDLKPENVMLGDFGEVLLLDWGLAVPTEGFEKSASISRTTAMGGTPAYMAPEMATGPVQNVGKAADIYLLGAILYEVITGKPPHMGADVMKCLVAAARNEIRPTEKKGELVDVALRAMATKPEDRYHSVREFQEAIRTYLSHTESIALATRAEEELEQARRSDGYQDYARSLFAFQEAHALWSGNERALRGKGEASLAYAASAHRKGDFDLGASLLDAADPRHTPLRAEIQAAQQERDQRQQRLKRLRFAVRAGVLLFLAVVSGASLWIWRERNKAVKAERLAVAQKRIALEQKQQADAAKEQEALARGVAEERKQQADEARDTAVAAKNEADQQREKAEYQAYIALIGLAAAKVEENAFGTARQVLAQCPPALRHWEWGRLQHMCQLSVRDYDAGSPVESLALAADETILTGGWNGLARIWNGRNGQVLHTLPHGALSFVYAVALSPDGQWAATGTNDREQGLLCLWDARTGQRVRVLQGHTDAVVSLAFSGDGQRLLSSSFDRTARLWNVATGELLRTFRGHRNWVWSAAFCCRRDAAGQPLPEERMVTASQDGFAIVWRLDRAEGAADEQSPPFRGHEGPVYAAVFSPDGERVATGGYDKRVLLWRPADLREFEFENVIHNETLSPANQSQRLPETPPQFLALDGHTAAVRSVAFDRAGNRLVSGGHDNTVRIWDVASGRLLETLRGHDSWVRGCRFTPDDRSVLSAGYDRQAKLWSIDRYEEVRRVPKGRILQGHSEDVLAAAFSPDGKSIVTASRDRTARTWDVSSANELVRLAEGHSFLASSAAFFPDGKLMITAAVDDTARLWDVTRGTEVTRIDRAGRNAAVAVSHDGKWIVTGSASNAAQLWELMVAQDSGGQVTQQVVLRGTMSGHRAPLTAAAFSLDDRLLFTGDANGVGRLWDASEKTAVRELRALRGHTARITSAAFLPNGQRVLTASGDGTVGQWLVSTGDERQDLLLKHTRGASVTSLAITPDGRFALTSCDDGKVRLWDIEQAVVVRLLTPCRTAADKRPGIVQRVAIDATGRRAVTVNPEAQDVRLWDLESGAEVVFPQDAAEDAQPLLDFRQRGLVWAANFSPDGSQLVTVGGDSARLWDLSQSTRPERESQSFIPHGSVACAKFSPDGEHIVTASWDNSARIWDARTGKGELKLQGHSGSVNSAEFSGDGRQVLTASSDGTAVLWDALTGNVLGTFRGHTAAVRMAVFAPHAQKMVTVSQDATARVWDLTSGETLQVLRGHRYGVLSAAFSSDGQRLLTGGEDDTAILWDLVAGKPILLLEGHTAAVTSVAFSPDDKRALTGSEDFTAKLWDTRLPADDAQREADAGADEPAAAGEPPRGKEILTLKGHQQQVTSVAFSGDGVLALTGSRDGTAIIWLAEGQWQTAAAPEPRLQAAH